MKTSIGQPITWYYFGNDVIASIKATRDPRYSSAFFVARLQHREYRAFGLPWRQVMLMSTLIMELSNV